MKRERGRELEHGGKDRVRIGEGIGRFRREKEETRSGQKRRENRSTCG